MRDNFPGEGKGRLERADPAGELALPIDLHVRSTPTAAAHQLLTLAVHHASGLELGKLAPGIVQAGASI
jgi:hypothetical protein